VSLIPANQIPLVQLCGQRDAALQKMDEAIQCLAKGLALAEEARDLASHAANGVAFSVVDRRQDSHYRRLFEAFSADQSREVFRKHTDACVWIHLIDAMGMSRLMDATAKEDFHKQLQKEVPEVNEGNVYATLASLHGDANLIFQRGLAVAFSSLDKRFKSHDAFQLGSRVILTNLFDEWGSIRYGSKTKDTIADIERVLAVLDGKEPNAGALFEEVSKSRKGWGRQQGVCETEYLRIKTYKNGNAHLWFTRDDLVQKANLVLAEYYGEVLPDGVPGKEETIKTKSGLPAKDLSFYPTPEPVVKALFHDLYYPNGCRVLEPSAGTGALALEAVCKGWEVDAIEIDAARVQQLSLIRGVQVFPGNFLQMAPRPEYDLVVMNPPFYGTHWMEHVIHAWDWLKPGGKLRTVLPATAELGETSKHKAFREWAEKHTAWGRPLYFHSLPAESFSSSGTRINTVILELHK